MNWIKKISTQTVEEEHPIIYLTPEALRHVYVMPAHEFEAFQNSKEFVPGGRLMEISRQFSYTVRKVADLREETVTYMNRQGGGKPARTSEPEDSGFVSEPIEMTVG